MATRAGAEVWACPMWGFKARDEADLILLTLTAPISVPGDFFAHMVYAAHSADVDTVIINGEVVMEGRRVLTMDEEE